MSTCRLYKELPACFPGGVPGAPYAPHTWCVQSVLLSHPSGEGVSHCGFDFVSLRTSDVEHLCYAPWPSVYLLW